jgi:hypothetical protein
MGDEVNLHKARNVDIPMLGPNGDVVLEERAGLGASIEASLELGFVGL